MNHLFVFIFLIFSAFAFSMDFSSFEKPKDSELKKNSHRSPVQGHSEKGHRKTL